MRTNKNYSSGFQCKSDAIAFLLLVLIWLVFPLLSANSQSLENKKSSVRNKGSSFLLQYNQNYKILFKAYKRNHSALDRMDLLIHRHRQNIYSGKSHLFITAYIRPEDLYNPIILNRTSIQGKIVRAYIKVRHQIAHRYCTLALDTNLHSNSLVRVKYIFGPTAACCHSVRLVADSYPIRSSHVSAGIISRHREEYKESPVRTEQVLTPIVSRGEKTKPNVIDPSLGDENELSPKTDHANQSVCIIPAFVDKRKHPGTSLLFGIKTNLFYWAGITPELKHRDFIPNIELEWYFNRHWSLNVDGAYVYTHNYNNDQEQWGVSSIAMEPRFWLNGSNCFTGIYVGVYGLIGQFDVKLNTISEYGHTGDFHEGGISLGYYLPLSSRWGIEVGGRFGYRAVRGDIYRYVYPVHFYYDSSYTQNGLKLTGIRLLLTYRLGKFKKQEQIRL